MKSQNSPSSRFLKILAISFFICILVYFITSLTLLWTNSDFRNDLVTSSSSSSSSDFTTFVSLDHIVFGLASSSRAWSKHKEFLKLWWKPHKLRGCVFVDSLPIELVNHTQNHDDFPHVCISEDTSRFRYTYKHGYRSSIRVAHIVSETVSLNHSQSGDVRWYVFGDGNTVFFPENLVKTLSKYDHNLWYFIGSNSEIYEYNKDNSFDMAFWGGGFALSAPLARNLAMVFDSCLERYPHLFGSDGRVYACLAELGVGLTHEPGFHQVLIYFGKFDINNPNFSSTPQNNPQLLIILESSQI
ncbi:Beta-1 3-glucosyltransferase [Bienertia sinuspersici]